MALWASVRSTQLSSRVLGFLVGRALTLHLGGAHHLHIHPETLPLSTDTQSLCLSATQLQAPGPKQSRRLARSPKVLGEAAADLAGS